MDMEERIDALEDAHRMLSAQHLALLSVCRVMLPLISADPAVVKRLLTSAYDINDEHMEAHGYDEEYCAQTRRWIDILSTEVLNVANISRRAPDSPAGG